MLRTPWTERSFEFLTEFLKLVGCTLEPIRLRYYVKPRLARLRLTSLPISARNAASEAAGVDNAGFSAGFGIKLATDDPSECIIIHVL